MNICKLLTISMATITIAGCKTKKIDTTTDERLQLSDISIWQRIHCADIHLFDTISIRATIHDNNSQQQPIHYQTIRHARLATLTHDTTTAISSHEQKYTRNDTKTTTKKNAVPFTNNLGLLLIISLLMILFISNQAGKNNRKRRPRG